MRTWKLHKNDNIKKSFKSQGLFIKVIMPKAKAAAVDPEVAANEAAVAKWRSKAETLSKKMQKETILFGFRLSSGSICWCIFVNFVQCPCSRLC